MKRDTDNARLFCSFCISTLLTTLTLTLFPASRAEMVLGKETYEFDFDGLPGAQHEFKIEINAGDVECFYQRVKQGGKIYARFEVSKLSHCLLLLLLLLMFMLLLLMLLLLLPLVLQLL